MGLVDLSVNWESIFLREYDIIAGRISDNDIHQQSWEHIPHCEKELREGEKRLARFRHIGDQAKKESTASKIYDKIDAQWSRSHLKFPTVKIQEEDFRHTN